jgi:hypothetical protein
MLSNAPRYQQKGGNLVDNLNHNSTAPMEVQTEAIQIIQSNQKNNPTQAEAYREVKDFLESIKLEKY